MDLPELVSLIGDPAPTPFVVDWPAVQSWLGTDLPGAYRQIGSTFGPWYVGDWVWVEVPCGDQEWSHGYTEWLRNTTRETRIDAREHSVAEVPDFHPVQGGLLAWAHTRRTDRFFWDTAVPDPDEWPVVVYAADLGPVADPWIHTGLMTVDFLGALIVEGIPISEFRRIGPTRRVAERTLYRLDAVPWTPPPPPPPAASLTERRRALMHGSGLAALRELIPPPQAPEFGPGTWPGLFDALGSGLPADYVELMATYGGGVWRGDVRFPPPLDLTGTGLVAHAKTAADSYRQLRAEFSDEFPLAVWPEPGGFLALADTVDGDYIGWLTVGEPDDWPVVVWPRHDDQGPPLAMGLVDTLLSVMRGQRVPGFATLDIEDDPLDFANFTPWSAAGG